MADNEIISSDEDMDRACLDMAVMVNDSDDDIGDFIPDTPSPVFLRRRLGAAAKPEPTRMALPSPIHSVPSTSTELPSEQSNRQARNNAMNRLRLKLQKNNHQKLPESDSDDEELRRGVESMIRKPDILLDSDSDAEFLPIMNLDGGSFEGCSGENEPRSGTSTYQPDYDSDIAEEELEHFLDGVLSPVVNTSHRLDDNACKSPRRSIGSGIKRKAENSTVVPEKKYRRSSTTYEIGDSVIVLEDSDTAPASPLSTLDALCNGLPDPIPQHSYSSIENFFGGSRMSSRTSRLSGRSNATSTVTLTSTRSRSGLTRSCTRTSTNTSGICDGVSGNDGFVRPTAPVRSARTPTESRLRRRGTKTPNTGNMSLLVSPTTRSNQQFVQDEAIARRLQEEMDREYAESLSNQMSPVPSLPPTVLTGSTRSPPRTGPGRRHTAAVSRAGRGGSTRGSAQTADLDYNTRMLMMIGEMSEYEWQVHRSTATGRDLPPAPTMGSDRSVDEFLNPEVISYVQDYHENRGDGGSTAPGSGTRRVGVNERSPVRPTTRRVGVTTRAAVSARVPTTARPSSTRTTVSTRATMGRSTPRTRTTGTLSAAERRQLETELDYDADMLMRIGGLSEDDWALHQAAWRENIPEPGNDSIDDEILNYLSVRQERRRPTTNRRGTTRRGGARGRAVYMGADSFNADDYEALLELAESVGEVKQRGLSTDQINMLPIKHYRTTAGNDTTECNICMVDYDDHDTLRILQCFHYFHTDCVDRWLKENASCPICRERVTFD